VTAPFDVCGPLPRGVTVLEASAGTGKTYTIAALAARYVAEGIPLERLLLVTFTRMATGELRERVRDRLVSVERGLARGGSDDPVVAVLAPDRDRALPRLRRALADFDAATIATTHGFCQEVLAGLGIEGDPDPDATFVEDVSDLVDEVVDDLYVRRFLRDGEPAFPRAQAAAVARAAVENPSVPLADAPGEVPQMRRRLAQAARDELERRKRALAVMTYDDLLTRLDAALGDAAAVERLRARYDVVLVDEFQDTDPVQWDILRRAFDAPGVTLVLIGDPKQAIYAFRGADVYAYLDAAREARTRATLETNRRSDQPLLDAYDALFGHARLGHEGIVYRRVRSACGDRGAALPGAPLRVRVVRRDHPGIELTPRARTAAKDSAVDYVARDVAAEVVRTLESGRVQPGDIAVLVRVNRQAARIREALDAAGVRAVINGAGSVLATEAAREWLTLLEALERPASRLRAHAAALTAFLGWSAERVACAGEPEREALHERLHDWARTLREHGVAPLAETIAVTEGLPRRVLAATDGERRLTDLRHVAELLHVATRREQLGTTALAIWLRRRIAEADDDFGDEERTRRLESDAGAVQVLTIHRSKGLEYPVVHVPFLWDAFNPRAGQPVDYHDGGRRLDVALAGPDFERHRRQHLREQRGEDLRLAYVALTRARHRAVVWWAPTWDSRHSPLGRLLFAQDDAGNVAPEGTRTPSDAEALARFAALRDAAAPGRIAVEDAALPGLPPSWTPPLEHPGELAAATFARALDDRWRRTSYSDITADAHDARVASEPEDDDTVRDEPAAPAREPAAGDLPLAALPAGARTGTLVHRVLEATDFAAADLDAELTAQVAVARAWDDLDVGDPARLVAGLRTAVETPLGPLLDHRALRSFGRRDRLDELAFELPLAGGDAPSGRLTLQAIAGVLRAHGDPLAGYAARLDDPALRAVVRGFLTGSIDLVVRVGDRFALLDYKTNRLAPPGEPLRLEHYAPPALAAEMHHAHYGLQALLYAVALHRYLRWRLPGYDPDRHLAGVFYLFLRGMTGDPAFGVFAWRPSGALVAALSDVLDAR
jgi:exodeoxyribonuclease V beta subunit